MNLRLLFGVTLLAVSMAACGATAPAPDNLHWTFDPPDGAKLLEQESSPDDMSFRAVYDLGDQQAVSVQATLFELSKGGSGRTSIDSASKPINFLGVNCNAQGKLRHLATGETATGKTQHMVTVKMCVDDPATGKTWKYDETVIDGVLESYQPK